MGSRVDSVAAATAVLKYNLFSGKDYQMSGRLRFLRRFALVGSAAIADTEVEIFVEQTKVGVFKNTVAGADKSPLKDDMKDVNVWVPPGSPLNAFVTDAPATNQIVWELEFA